MRLSLKQNWTHDKYFFMSSISVLIIQFYIVGIFIAKKKEEKELNYEIIKLSRFCVEKF